MGSVLTISLQKSLYKHTITDTDINRHGIFKQLLLADFNVIFSEGKLEVMGKTRNHRKNKS